MAFKNTVSLTLGIVSDVWGVTTEDAFLALVCLTLIADVLT